MLVACLLTALVFGTLGVAACGGETTAGRIAAVASPSPTAIGRPMAPDPGSVTRSAASLAGPSSCGPRKAGTFGWKFGPSIDIGVT